MEYRIKNKAKYAQGFTLLVAVLIGSLLLSIGFSIFNIVYKETILASSGRESQSAFFAADTAMECALYWDQNADSFSRTTPATTITCNGGSVAVSSSLQGSTYIRQFSLTLNGGEECSSVTVRKITSPSLRTEIVSSGYNTCTTGAPRRTERTLRVSYSEF
jgi:hypothetical protein